MLNVISYCNGILLLGYHGSMRVLDAMAEQM